ncbi:MAG: heme-binding protein [Planctomycetota bacterium]
MKYAELARGYGAIVLIGVLGLGTGGCAVAADDRSLGSEGESADQAIELEAGLPAGYPAPGPAGEVVVKRYPAYRAARAEGRGAFRKLFGHIREHDIAMTAPVEMTLKGIGTTPENERGPVEAGQKSSTRRVDMYFMYPRPDQGEVGVDGTVEVLDFPETRVLSLGFFGAAKQNRVDAALDHVRAALAQRPDLVAAGPARLLGYHSPFVTASRRYHEVQIPVKDRPTEGEQASNN